MPILFRPRGVSVSQVATFSGRRSRRIYGPALLSSLAATLYTVPTGVRTVIRHIHVSNPTVSSVDFTLSIGIDAAGTRLWNGQPVGVDRLIQEFRDHTLNAGDVIQAFASTNNGLNLTIDGYEEALTAPSGASFGDGTFGSGTFGG